MLTVFVYRQITYLTTPTNIVSIIVNQVAG